ncbi:MAG: Glutamate synthase domain 1 [Candidatus Methanohalarchaeum thermophilum]|uniref:Glutamate synthase domain 1 n=1 Tax=Methanohalarchaeum thermophilum TaxID=1903181 RepID=A0A1Q6DXC1_METT1|nr:MAG: Glutamate synthase domain 1 [Candidatus Methanohalarchaeum thermophilum]
MCGIAGIYSTKNISIDDKILQMLEKLQHRGEDSAGVALYGILDLEDNEYFIEIESGKNQEKIEEILGNKIQIEIDTEPPIYSSIYRGKYEILRKKVSRISQLNECKVINAGKAYTIKDKGKVKKLSNYLDEKNIKGTHGIGHTRFSTESEVNRYHAHPFQSFARPDVNVVHNGQITNYREIRENLESDGLIFDTQNDTECIAHYIANQLNKGDTLEKALKNSINDMDGPFSFIIAIENGIGVARDSLGLRPTILAQNNEIFAIASEEIAIRESMAEIEEIKHLKPGEVATMTGG